MRAPTRQSSVTEDADRVIDAAISHVLHGVEPAVIVKSPPGAGKTFLVECACAAAVDDGSRRVLVVTPGVKQAYDVAERLLAYDLPRLEVMHAKHRSPPSPLQGRVTVSQGWDPMLNQGPGVLVANAHILAAYLDRFPPGTFDLMVLDEAYQLAAQDFLPIADLSPRLLLVGDPGQLPPVASVDTTNLEAATHKIHRSTPSYLLDRFPGTPVYGLPVTRRLLPDTARMVQESFYLDLPFESVVSPEARRLHFAIPGVEPGIDRALDAIAGGATIVALLVPGEPPIHEEADLEVAAVMARVAERAMVRQPTWVGERCLEPSDIGCIDPHVISGGAVSDRLRQVGLGDVSVDTVERWQGLQVPLSIVRHPLSKGGRPQPFDLESGRWCVALSRHQIGCIIVGRSSITATIETYVHGCDNAPAGAADAVWSGFEAHRRIWRSLIDQDRIYSV